MGPLKLIVAMSSGFFILKIKKNYKTICPFKNIIKIDYYRMLEDDIFEKNKKYRSSNR